MISQPDDRDDGIAVPVSVQSSEGPAGSPRSENPNRRPVRIPTARGLSVESSPCSARSDWCSLSPTASVWPRPMVTPTPRLALGTQRHRRERTQDLRRGQRRSPGLLVQPRDTTSASVRPPVAARRPDQRPTHARSLQRHVSERVPAHRAPPRCRGRPVGSSDPEHGSGALQKRGRDETSVPRTAQRRGVLSHESGDQFSQRIDVHDDIPQAPRRSLAREGIR